MSLRDEYQQELKTRFQEQKVKLEVLRAKAKRAAARGKVLAYEELEVADKNLAEAKAKLKVLVGTSSGAIAELKSGIARAYSELKTASHKAAEHLRANTPPPPPPPKPTPKRSPKTRPLKTRHTAQASSKVKVRRAKAH
jgi:hypothetical protein